MKQLLNTDKEYLQDRWHKNKEYNSMNMLQLKWWKERFYIPICFYLRHIKRLEKHFWKATLFASRNEEGDC